MIPVTGFSLVLQHLLKKASDLYIITHDYYNRIYYESK